MDKRYSTSSGKCCAVIGCNNTSKKKLLWQLKKCEIHEGKLQNVLCIAVVRTLSNYFMTIEAENKGLNVQSLRESSSISLVLQHMV